MVHKFGEFLNESKVNFPLTYSVITALAVFKPEFFDFLNANKNRYFLTDNSFWQSLILEIKKTPEIKLEKQHLVDIKGISIEEDWIKLKKCFLAGLKIKEQFPQLTSIKVCNDAALIIDGFQVIRGKKIEDRISSEDLDAYLGFNGIQIYNNGLWKYLVSHWIELMKKYLTPEYLEHYNFFLEKIEESKKELNWSTFKNFKVKGLGLRIDSLPKLYYNSFYDLNLAISIDEKCFSDFKTFVVNWLNFKNDILNKKILYPLIQQNKERLEAAKKMIIKFHSLEDKKYFRFDSKLNLIEIPSKQEFELSDSISRVKENFLINKRKDLIISIDSNDINLKIMIAMKGLCPSLVSIKSKFDESDGLNQMGEL